MMVSFVLSFFPRDVLDEILNLIESVSEDFPSYSCFFQDSKHVVIITVVEDLSCLLVNVFQKVQNRIVSSRQISIVRCSTLNINYYLSAKHNYLSRNKCNLPV